MARPSIWDDPAKVDELVALWNSGLSTAQIGKALGTSKNSVIGRANRMGLRGRVSPIKADPEKVLAQQKKAHEAKRILAEEQKKASRQYAAELDGETPRLESGGCRWIEGDPKDRDFDEPLEIIYCRRKTIRGRMTDAYCDHHYQRAYKPRKDDDTKK